MEQRHVRNSDCDTIHISRTVMNRVFPDVYKSCKESYEICPLDIDKRTYCVAFDDPFWNTMDILWNYSPIVTMIVLLYLCIWLIYVLWCKKKKPKIL